MRKIYRKYKAKNVCLFFLLVSIVGKVRGKVTVYTAGAILYTVLYGVYCHCFVWGYKVKSSPEKNLSVTIIFKLSLNNLCLHLVFCVYLRVKILRFYFRRVNVRHRSCGKVTVYKAGAILYTAFYGVYCFCLFFALMMNSIVVKNLFFSLIFELLLIKKVKKNKVFLLPASLKGQSSRFNECNRYGSYIPLYGGTYLKNHIVNKIVCFRICIHIGLCCKPLYSLFVSWLCLSKLRKAVPIGKLIGFITLQYGR